MVMTQENTCTYINENKTKHDQMIIKKYNFICSREGVLVLIFISKQYSTFIQHAV